MAPLLVIIIFILGAMLFGGPILNMSFSASFLDRDKNLTHIFLTSDDKYRLFTPLGNFPPELIEAVLLQEDQYFYQHFGINPGAILRSAKDTWIIKKRRYGASTITMQVARMKYKIQTRSIPGKIEQIFKALYLEARFSKQEILEAYLNLAPMGGNLEGFPAGAWFYFGSDIKDIETSELLFLTVIPQNPNIRSPKYRKAPAITLEARSILFDKWIKKHPEDLLIRPEIQSQPYLDCSFPSIARHYNEMLKKELPHHREAVRTTIDTQKQKLCEYHLKAYLEQNKTFGVSNGSIMLVDWTSMEVLAAVGSSNFFDESIQGQVNGTIARRSPGSTLKPFIYALAVDQGKIHSETMLKDTPVSFKEYAPDNYKGEYRGPLHAWDALVDSRNIPAVFLATQISNPDLYDTLNRAGIHNLKNRDHYGLSIVLGSAEVTMFELVQLYGSLVHQGTIMPIATIVDKNYSGNNSLNKVTLFSPASAWIAKKMLERNPPAIGVRPQTSKDTPVAWKTGTSIGFKDSWAIAIFDRYIISVWIGNFSGEGNAAFIGRLMSGPLLFGLVDSILADIPSSKRIPYQQPPVEVSTVKVCAVSGGIPGDDCPQIMNAWFIPGVSPITRCTIHRKIYIDSRTGYRTDESDKPWVRSETREFWPTDLLELFEQAGLPRLKPPPYPPDCSSSDMRVNGTPPVIISPLMNTEYILRPESSKYNQMVLQASADTDTEKVFWFANSEFLGSAKPEERLLWNPRSGVWTVTVVDSKGRSASIRLTVTEEK